MMGLDQVDLHCDVDIRQNKRACSSTWGQSSLYL